VTTHRSAPYFTTAGFTGEILQPNTPGRDPIITRIIWLRGLEAENAHAYYRGIYIHGTPEEKDDRPARQLRLHSNEIVRCLLALRAVIYRRNRANHGPTICQK
jgi:hypothetical protein